MVLYYTDRVKVAKFLSASFIRLGSTLPKTEDNGSSQGSSSIAGEKDGEGEDSQQQQESDREGWDREMQEKAYGWEQQWDEERQRFYYFNAETWETSYTAPFKSSVSLGKGHQ